MASTRYSPGAKNHDSPAGQVPEPSPPFVLNPAPVPGVRMAPAQTGTASCAFRSSPAPSRCSRDRSAAGDDLEIVELDLPGELAHRHFPRRQLPGFAWDVHRSSRQRFSLYARQCSLLRHISGLTCTASAVARASYSAITKGAEEVLALTKINWNSTLFDQKLPAPIKAPREVGRILKHIEFGIAVSPDFRRYT